MKNNILPLLILLCLSSCKEKPSFCENPYEITAIKLIPTKHWTAGREITIENDSLIGFISNQICEIKDVSYSTGNRIDGESIEIQFVPNKVNKTIYFVKRGYDYNDYRFREGTTYFKNDLLCELIFRLTGIENKDTTERDNS